MAPTAETALEPEEGQRQEPAEPVPEDPAPVPPPEFDPDSDEAKQRRRRYLLRRFWHSARGFWGRRGDRYAWPLTAALFTVILLTIAAQYGLNRWNRVIFDALEQRDAARVYLMMVIFPPLIALTVAFAVLGVYLRMTTQRRWRAWTTGHVVDHWLSNGRYYQLNLVSGDHDNPEYRIAEDLRIATDAPVDFVHGVTTAALSASTFIVVLWTIGGALTVEIAGASVVIPGFLVVAAVIYALLASIAMVIIGRRFVDVSESKNQTEADYRYVLTRVRENGESIALLGGEAEERAGVDRSLREVLRRWRHLCGQYMRTTSVSQTSTLIAPVVPILLSAPKFLDGSMSLGQVMQAASAFTLVQSAFGWLVDNYPRLADWNAGARRVASLLASLDALQRAEEGDGVGRIERGETEAAALRLRNLSVTLDDGTAVVNEAEIAIQPGERVLVTGESGTGKSTLVRAVAGLWPWGAGEIQFMPEAKVFLLPQRPYVPTGTLRRAATYPAAAEQWTTEEIGAALTEVGLEHLVERIEEEAAWDQTLSGGEKQRLAFARLLLHRPDIVVLDEATSALDPPSQDKLMALISETLLDATIVSVGHRPELEAFHSRKIILERRIGGARLVSDIDLLSRPGRPRLLVRMLKQRRGKARAAKNGSAGRSRN